MLWSWIFFFTVFSSFCSCPVCLVFNKYYQSDQLSAFSALTLLIVRQVEGL